MAIPKKYRASFINMQHELNFNINFMNLHRKTERYPMLAKLI